MASLGRLVKELQDLQQKPIDGVKVSSSFVAVSAGALTLWVGCLHPRGHEAAAWTSRLAASARALQVIMNEDNITDIQAEYDGPSGTPYEQGLFRMRLVLGPDFPATPPKGEAQRTLLGASIMCTPCYRKFSLMMACFTPHKLAFDRPLAAGPARSLQATSSPSSSTPTSPPLARSASTC